MFLPHQVLPYCYVSPLQIRFLAVLIHSVLQVPCYLACTIIMPHQVLLPCYVSPFRYGSLLNYIDSCLLSMLSSLQSYLQICVPPRSVLYWLFRAKRGVLGGEATGCSERKRGGERKRTPRGYRGVSYRIQGTGYRIQEGPCKSICCNDLQRYI